ncbi:MAG TPA: hypothetical protein VJO12_03780 [Stellaceae bacterium]|nr:hypothetical protein [Stellaceae bacterium]
MRLVSRRRRDVGLILVALFALSLAACSPPPSVNSPQVDEMYKRMYGPIIDGG